MTKKKQEAVEPVAPVTEQPAPDYFMLIDVRLSALSAYLTLDKLAKFFLKDGGAQEAEVLVAECRNLLVKMKEHSHGE